MVKDLSEASRKENFARSISCVTPDGPAGITHKLKLFERHGINAVFFVDPMPALVWGVAAIEDVVAPILEAGQDVQLHCHTEWLEMLGDDNPLSSKRTGRNLFDFHREDQHQILEYARDTLIAAGAPKPIAFRAGNYGANDDTLRALSQLGIRYDSSHCPALADACQISLGPKDRNPIYHAGLLEVPVGSIASLRGGQRHAQITALTLREMTKALRHARKTGRSDFTLVTHSFELINRKTRSVNHIVRRRFEGLCSTLETMEGVSTGNYRDAPPVYLPQRAQAELLPACPWRTSYRIGEQILSNTLYGA